MKFFRLFALLALVVSGCASISEEAATKDWNAQQISKVAKEAMNDGDYEMAIKYYRILEARFPLGQQAQQAQIDMMYAHYKANEPEEAILAAERFMKQYPTHPHLDYVYYIKGLVNFNRDEGILQDYLPLDMSQRDQGASRVSFQDFQELVKRFPASQYSEDAHQRMFFLRNALARYELHVADYYHRRGAYVAAARRAQYVVEHFDRTPAVPDALYLMAKSYHALNMNDLAADALRVLKQNHPEHPGLAELAASLQAGG